MGIIAVDSQGNVCHEFNGERMHRALMAKDGQLHVINLHGLAVLPQIELCHSLHW